MKTTTRKTKKTIRAPNKTNKNVTMLKKLFQTKLFPHFNESPPEIRELEVETNAS